MHQRNLPANKLFLQSNNLDNVLNDLKQKRKRSKPNKPTMPNIGNAPSLPDPRQLPKNFKYWKDEAEKAKRNFASSNPFRTNISDSNPSLAEALNRLADKLGHDNEHNGPKITFKDLPKFSGGGQKGVRKWADQIIQLLSATRWSDKSKILGIGMSLYGAAKTSAEEKVKKEPRITSRELIDYIVKKYDTDQRRTMIETELFSLNKENFQP